MNYKKKTINFEGAQYRRIRKMIEENKKSGINSSEDKDIVGLSNHNFVEIEKIPKQRRVRILIMVVYYGSCLKIDK